MKKLQSKLSCLDCFGTVTAVKAGGLHVCRFWIVVNVIFIHKERQSAYNLFFLKQHHNKEQLFEDPTVSDLLCITSVNVPQFEDFLLFHLI